MCRRCGAPDRRPSARRRRELNLRLAELHGNGVICPCYWCGTLLSAWPLGSRLVVAGHWYPLTQLERDRLEPGGPYSFANLVPACPPCNKARTYTEQLVPQGCQYGGWSRTGGEGVERVCSTGADDDPEQGAS